MFLKALKARNRAFLEAAVALHRAGRVPAGAYLLDLDTMTENARLMSAEAARLGLDLLAMTKQIGRNPPALDALKAGGIGRFVAVDMACARPIHANGHGLAHIGHLGQIPRHDAAEAATMRADYWTVFNQEKAAEAARAAAAHGHEQALIARIQAPGDTFYSGHEGASTQPTSRPWRMRSTACRAAASQGSPPSPPCSSTKPRARRGPRPISRP